METLPPFQTVYFVILKGYVVGEVTGLHFDRDFGVLHDDFDGRVVVRSSVVIEPNNEGRILLFCIIAQREFRQTIVFHNGHNGGHDIADVVHKRVLLRLANMLERRALPVH